MLAPVVAPPGAGAAGDDELDGAVGETGLLDPHAAASAAHPTITRVAVTREEDANIVVGEESGQGESGKTTEMGRKAMVPYGLYRGYGFVNPHLGKQTGFSVEDLSIVWEALQYMWDLDRSASRGLMACRGLYIFSHATAVGNAPAHALFECIEVRCQDGVEVPRKFSDYQVAVNEQGLPEGVTLTRLVG